MNGEVGNMLLAVDVGNTQTVVGVYSKSDLINMWRLATNRVCTADELRVSLISLFQSAGLDLSCVHRAALSSVVPQLTQAWCSAVRECCGVDMLICSAQTAGQLFCAHYPNVSEIGADRIADAVAMKAIYGYPGIVVDFGTATNIEVIDSEGFFVGGIIAPGLQTSAQTLFTRGAQLPAVALEAPSYVIGTNTVEAMQSGIVLGEVDRVEGLIKRVFKQLGYETFVVATGGLAGLVAKHCETITHVNPELTLEGLRLISDCNANS
ncbi:type III pantothenate kinase [Adlercreutzia sp. ZJ154]|uniref:type III pantothenate kinase n=1 Tax=Adlercreutzia sp. ZJ154 TaxID=2709790 RepID=UPI001F14FEA7|nr:type III pantothenate kinase [Adlercreutzia sp. ZJ154]